jgi:membrane fusion protein, multidrug efflux system
VRKNRNLAMIACFTALAASSVAGCKQKDVAGPQKSIDKAVKVETKELAMAKVPRYLTLTGSILPDKQSEVAASVGGRITATLVERGAAVRIGQVIAVVDSKQAGLSAQAAVAQYQAAESQVTLAKQDCERADKLMAQGAIAQAEFDRLKTQCSAQLSQANSARANADIAGKLAADTIIRAPMDGIIGERYINVGEYVQPSTKVASIYAVNPVRISISVPEDVVGQVNRGQELMVRVAAYGQRRFPATIEYVSPALRSATRDLIVEAKAKNDDLALKAGMFATVELAVGEEDHLVAPQEAIRIDGAVKRLFVAKDKQAFEMVVRTGVTKDGRIALLEDLKPGTQVIVSPLQGLRDGQAIEQ